MPSSYIDPMHTLAFVLNSRCAADEAEVGALRSVGAAAEAALCAKLAGMNAEEAVLADYTAEERAAYARIQQHIQGGHSAPAALRSRSRRNGAPPFDQHSISLASVPLCRILTAFHMKLGAYGCFIFQVIQSCTSELCGLTRPHVLLSDRRHL